MIKQLYILRNLKNNCLHWIRKDSLEEYITGPGTNVGRNVILMNGLKDIENGKKHDVHTTNV